MENLAPPLELVLKVKYDLDKGFSVRYSILNYINQNSDDFRAYVVRWLSLFDQGKSTDSLKDKIQSNLRKSVLDVLEKGLKGEPILKTLELLEQEIILSCEAEIDEKLQKLPFLLLIPLLLFQLPAFLLLLFGPLMGKLLSSFGSV